MNMDDVAYLQTAWQDVWEYSPQNMPDVQPIIDAYGQKKRHYHTTQHLRECLQYWQTHQKLMSDPFAVGVALFYHDVVYEPQRPDNEVQSVAWMRGHLAHVLDEANLHTMSTLILDTQYHTASLGELSQWLLDIDLSILGAQPKRFAQYQDQIRQEYDFVPPDVYAIKRRKVLQHFANLSPLYQTQVMHEALEQQAKINLSLV